MSHLDKIKRESRLLYWEELTVKVRDGLIREYPGWRTDALLLDTYEPLTLIRLTAETGEIMLLELVNPRSRSRSVLARFFGGSWTEDLGFCSSFPLLIEKEEDFYFQYEAEPGIVKTRRFPRILLIEVLEDRSLNG